MTAAEYDAELDSLCVETEPIYQPGYLAPGLTWCNRLVSDATARLGCPIPFLPANAQHDWLRNLDGGSRAGWVEVHDLPEAIINASRGYPTVASWRNNLRPHGHIALVRSNGHICAAGAHNFNDAALTRSFGPVEPRFFTHAAPAKEV